MDKTYGRFKVGRRGAALPTVLALIFLLLVVGLAMGSLSILSLQFNRRQLDATRSELAARSAVATFVSKLHAQDVEAGMDPLAPEPYRVVDRLGETFSLEQDGYTAKLSFTSTTDYSSDNLGGDEPMVGSPDSDEVARVPPFTLDLVVQVTGPAGSCRYRVGLRRVWPYALYTKLGPIVLMGDPQPGEDSSNPTRLEGDVYTSWNGNAAGGGVTPSGYGLEPFVTPFDALAYLEARSGLHPRNKADWPLIVGEIVARNPPLLADQTEQVSADTHYLFYAASRVPEIPSANPADPTFAPTGPSLVNGGNELSGDFVYAYEDGQEIERYPCVMPTPVDPSAPLLGPVPSLPNRFTGESLQRRPLAVDPLQSAPGSSLFSSQSFQQVPGLEWASPELQSQFGVTEIWADKRQVASGPAQRPWMLSEDLVLEGSHYVIDGSLTNRHVIYGQGDLGEGLYVRENRAGMRLQNTTLHVKGDLDLGAGSFAGPDEEERITLVGSAATLIVDGKLILGNATINAQDQGFMIFAKDIVLTGGGNFFGLMIAENSISILSRPDNPLSIFGALLCQGRGGIVLRGATVKHDPEYLKSLNQAGDFQIVSWKKIH